MGRSGYGPERIPLQNVCPETTVLPMRPDEIKASQERLGRTGLKFAAVVGYLPVTILHSDEGLKQPNVGAECVMQLPRELPRNGRLGRR